MKVSAVVPVLLSIGLMGSNALADIVVSVSGAGPLSLTPTADTLTLNANTITVPNECCLKVDLQTGTFYVGDSGQLVGTFSFNITEDVTINDGFTSETHTITLSGQDDVTLSSDVLTIFAAPQAAYFSHVGYYVSITGPLGTPDPIAYTSPALGVFQSTNFTLQAFVPEPSSILFLGFALAGVALLRHRQSKAVSQPV